MDDSRISRRQILSLIDTEHFNITECANGSEALEQIAKQDFDLMLLDLLMPVLDGIAVLQYLKDKNINQKTIVLSADIQIATKTEVMELGAKAFLNKPPDKGLLNSTIYNVLSLTE